MKPAAHSALSRRDADMLETRTATHILHGTQRYPGWVRIDEQVADVLIVLPEKWNIAGGIHRTYVGRCGGLR